MQNQELRSCISCGKIIRGRSDKKFCNDYCRNTHNNSLKSTGNNYVRNLNNKLNKNRRILESILGEKSQLIKIKKEKLSELGFDFIYITEIRKNNLGSHYYFCYEYGYFPINKQWMILMKNENV